MKKVVLGIFLSAFVAVGVFAQDQEPGTGKKHRGGEQGVMAKLNLTEAQKTQLKALRETYQKDVSNVLTDEQKASMKKMMAERKGKHGGRKGGFGKHHRADFDKMKKELNLTDDQVSALKKNRAESFQKMKALRDDKSKTEDQKKAEIKQFREQQHQNLKSILTEEQLKKLDEQKKSHRPAPVQS